MKNAAGNWRQRQKSGLRPAIECEDRLTAAAIKVQVGFQARERCQIMPRTQFHRNSRAALLAAIAAAYPMAGYSAPAARVAWSRQCPAFNAGGRAGCGRRVRNSMKASLNTNTAARNCASPTARTFPFNGSRSFASTKYRFEARWTAGKGLVQPVERRASHHHGIGGP